MVLTASTAEAKSGIPVLRLVTRVFWSVALATKLIWVLRLVVLLVEQLRLAVRGLGIYRSELTVLAQLIAAERAILVVAAAELEVTPEAVAAKLIAVLRLPVLAQVPDSEPSSRMLVVAWANTVVEQFGEATNAADTPDNEPVNEEEQLEDAEN